MSPFTPSPLRSIVIGAGFISEAHLEYLSSSPRAKLVAVCDLSRAMAEFAAERFGAEIASTDYKHVLTQERPDIAHVLTPAATHERIARDCLAAGCHVIVEKPISINHAGFISLWQAAEQAGRRLVENHNYRFNEPVLALEQMVKKGTLGEIAEVEVRLQLNIIEVERFVDPNVPHESHRLPCGAIHEFISHIAYLTLRFLPNGNPETDRIRASWCNHSQNPLFLYDDLDATVIRGTCHAHIRFSARNAPDCFLLTLRGRQGSASCDLFLPQIELQIPRAGGKQLTPLINQFKNGVSSVGATAQNFLNKVRQKTPLEGIQTFLDRIYKAISEGTEPPVSFNDMDNTSRMIDALLAEGNRL